MSALQSLFTSDATDHDPAPAADTQLWICEPCGFVYDPAEGDPDGGIPPGMAFEDLPATWFCPVCGARKSDFVPFNP